MSQVLLICICFVLPVGLAIYLFKKQKASWLMFGLGMLTFFITQIAIRISVLSYLQGQAQFYVFMLQEIPYLLFLAITASLCKEVS